MSDESQDRERTFDGAIDFLLFLFGTLTALVFAYTLYLVVAAMIRGELGGSDPAIVGLLLWGAASAVLWLAKSRLRARRRGVTSDSM